MQPLPIRLSHWNDDIARLTLARQTQLTYRNGGFTQYAVLTYPPNYDPHRRYPLVLRVHGGPQLTSLVAFEPWYQLAAARGYIVLAPNYRGSSDAGNAFERSIIDDASAGPGTDIMAAIDAVKRMNIIDPNRIGISGWSYGGQMTTWMIGHYDIFKVAVAGAPVTDLAVDYAIADDILDDRAYFGFSPNDSGKLAVYRAQSPITYAAHIHTPTLLMSNVYDVRVPAVENYELFHALARPRRPGQVLRLSDDRPFAKRARPIRRRLQTLAGLVRRVSPPNATVARGLYDVVGVGVMLVRLIFVFESLIDIAVNDLIADFLASRVCFGLAAH